MPVIGPFDLPPEQIAALRERGRRSAAAATGYDWGTVDLVGLSRGTGLPPAHAYPVSWTIAASG